MTLPQGYKVFTDGSVLTADEIVGYLQQGILVFDDASARTTALTGNLREGMYSYLKSDKTTYVYAANQWKRVGGIGNANFSNTATGTYTDGGIDYKYVTFTASGTLTIPTGSDGLADLLIVGGGGGGANWRGGGGGAGAHYYLTDVYLPSGSLTVTVGAGGAGGDSTSTFGKPGNNGIASRCGDYFSPGGGGGGQSGENAVAGFQTVPGLNGGSGGGGLREGAGGLGISGVGNDGGVGADLAGGGGGGAGGVGSNASANAGANGGAGAANSITNTSTTRAGGGGGGGQSTAGTGGSGGGGNGGGNNPGTANTGSGGGGGAATSGSTGGSGGSGVVIVRVKV
jgi:hypothetical protein